MKRLRVILAFVMASVLVPIVATPASAATLPQGQVVTVSAAEAQTLITAATQRGELVAYSPAANGEVSVIRMTVLSNAPGWGCANGIGCAYSGYYGGGFKIPMSVGSYGTNHCWDLNGSINDIVSSATADYGSGLYLRLYNATSCGFGATFSIAGAPGHWVTFAGDNAPFDNVASSFQIS